MLYNLEIGSVYDFVMLAPSVLGVNYKESKVLGLLDFTSANAIQDITPIHASVYSALPPGTPKNASDLIYIKIRTSTGEIRVIAMNWLASQPLLVVNADVTVTIQNLPLSLLPNLRQVLQHNGFVDFSIATTQ